MPKLKSSTAATNALVGIWTVLLTAFIFFIFAALYIARDLLIPLTLAALLTFLVIFMLLKREDLRSRLIRVAGRGRISATTRAMDDAGARVTRYLLMQMTLTRIPADEQGATIASQRLTSTTNTAESN